MTVPSPNLAWLTFWPVLYWRCVWERRVLARYACCQMYLVWAMVYVWVQTRMSISYKMIALLEDLAGDDQLDDDCFLLEDQDGVDCSNCWPGLAFLATLFRLAADRLILRECP